MLLMIYAAVRLFALVGYIVSLKAFTKFYKQKESLAAEITAIGGLTWATLAYSVVLGQHCSKNKLSPLSVLKEAVIKRGLSHAFFGVFYAVSTLATAYASGLLPGYLYSVLKGTQIIFTVLLNILVTKRKFKPLHWVAVLIMVSATVLTAFGPPEGDKKPLSNWQKAGGIGLVMAGSCASAVIAIGMEKMFSSGHWDRGNVTIFEALFLQGIVTAGVVTVISAFDGMGDWAGQLADGFASTQNVFGYPKALLIVAMLVISAGRILGLLAYLGISAYSGALFGWILSTVQRVIQSGVFLMIPDFKEPTHWTNITGISLSVVAFLVYIFAGIDKLKVKGGDGGGAKAFG